MELVLSVLLLAVGFVLLVKGADWFVDGSSSVARLLKIPSVIIGLTIVSIGTSAPEAAVSITASLAGSNEIAVSNIVGSNIFNLLVVIGVCAIIKAFASDKDIIKRDLPINTIASIILLAMIFDGTLSRIEGIILLVLMVLYILMLIRNALKNRDEGEDIKTMSPLKSLIFIAIGIAAIVLGGDFVVDNAKVIASALGMGDMLIGLTIVAIGTSLPELVTSIVAARKGESGLALGNAVGSCIFNILLILGVSATLSPIHLSQISASEALVDASVLIGVTVLTYLFSRTKEKTVRWEGIIYVLVYSAYIAYAIMRAYNLI